MPITRRRLLATSGAGLAGTGAVTLLAACGTDEEEPSAERDAELLNTALEAQATVAQLYSDTPASQEGSTARALDTFSKEADDQLRRLRESIEGAGGTPSDTAADAPQAESQLEALALALTTAIGAYNAAVGDLSSSSLRATVLELGVADAAQLAAIHGLLGEEQAPTAFVTGLDEAPLVAEEAT
jgi:hypothetical protein